VLAPVTLAAMMGFVIAPIVRKIRSLGVGQTTAAMTALLVTGLTIAGIAFAIFAQLGAMSEDLPQYEATAKEKIAVLRQATLGRLQDVQGRLGKLAGDATPTPKPATVSAARLERQSRTAPAAPAAAAPDESRSVLSAFVLAVWTSMGTVGVVVLVLVFALLEQDSLRDRLIRLTGGRDVRAATSAFNDAGQRLGRYFMSQFLVNIGVGIVIWALLLALGVPYAMVWAVLAGLLRFVPYVGFPAAAVSACAMAAAMAPGWDLVLYTALVFFAVEVIAAYVVEPLLYGHTTGMSPFSVVVAAVFWGALWGPVGLLLSTPLTLCLVVAGRHVQALAFMDILFGDAPALDLSQRFYQRCLSGDAVEILAGAHAFLKRKTLAAYCDKVVMPAFKMGREDFEQGKISAEQLTVADRAVSRFFSELSRTPRSKRAGTAVLDDGNIGLRLRQARQNIEGRWQGPLNVPPGSILMCVSMADDEAQLMAELLVRVLRSEHFDARHVTVQELSAPPADASVDSIGTVFVVGTRLAHVAGEDERVLNESLAHLPQAHVVLMQLWPETQPAVTDQMMPERVHHTAYSFEEAVALVRQGPR